jgi:hypothetical protein
MFLHIARKIRTDRDGATLGEVELRRGTDENLAELKQYVQRTHEPAYIESLYTEARFLPGIITFKNSAMKRWERETGVTAYR